MLGVLAAEPGLLQAISTCAPGSLTCGGTDANP
jgi:hypothetical protein